MVAVMSAGVLLALLSASTAEGKWVEVRGPHFEVVSQTSERVALRLAGDLEAFHGFLCDLLGVQGASAPLPTKVLVFSDPGAFERAVSGKARSADWRVIGQFIAGEHGNLMLMVLGATDDASDVLFHEYVHNVVRNTTPVMPDWLNEGLAEFFSTFEVRGDEVIVGRTIRRHLQWLVDNRLIPTQRLMGLTRGSERDRVGTFYAQSWALVHYLLVSGVETRAQLASFLERSRSGVSAEEAFRQAFGADPQALDVAVNGYVKGRRFGFYRLPRTFDTSSLAARRIDDATVAVHLAELQMSRRPPELEAARAQLDEALELRPDFARAHAARGRLLEVEGDGSGALEAYRRAVALVPDVPEPWYHLARLELGSIPRGVRFSLGPELQARVEEIRRLLREALARKPDYGPAFALLGRSYLVEPSAATVGVAASTRAYSLMRYRFDVLQELAMLTSLAGGQQRAFNLIEGPFRQLTNEEATSRARLDLARVELELCARELIEEEAGTAAARLESLRSILGGEWPPALEERAGELELATQQAVPD